MRIHIIIIIAVFIPFVSVQGGEILPMNWLTPEQLKQAERPIQEQLDTGKAMGATAWDMAALKDARMLLMYIMIYERLPDDVSRANFRSEQQAWIQQRHEAVQSLAKSDGGSMVALDQASKHMELTDARIAILSQKLPQHKN